MTLRSCLLVLATTAALAAPANADDRILIIPFSTLNVPANQQWVAQAAQESLIADLGQVKGLIPIAFSGQVIVEDNATAARLARTNNATFAIRGSAQVVGENIRLTAQLIDAQSGNTLRTALVTGATADLFRLEDDLAVQICGTSAGATNAVTAVPATTTTTSYVGPVLPPTPVVVEYPNPQVIVVTQPEPVYIPTYVYPYDYTYYYSSGFRFFTYNSNRNPHDGDRDRPGDGRGGRGGRDDGDRPGDRGGDRGGRPGTHIVNNTGASNPTALPIPTTGALPIPTKSDLPIPRNNVLPTPPRIDIPVPTRSSAPVLTRSAPPPPAASTPVITRSQPAARPSPKVSLPAASASIAAPMRSVVSPAPARARADVPAMSPSGPRASGGVGRGSRNNID